MNCDEAGKLLDAYVDGELDLAHQLEFEAHLEGCAACTTAIEQITNFKALVRSNMPVYQAPPELRSKIRASLRSESKPKIAWFVLRGKQLAYAAALVALGCALSWTWFSLSAPKDDRLVADAISDHARSLMVSHLVDCASGDQHTVRPWFNGKLDYSPPVPDLSQAGYPIRGGRIDMLDRRPVAAIVYEHGKHVINLFIWPAGDHKIDMEVRSERGYQFCAGNISGFNYFCISDVTGPDLEAFEDEFREHFNL